MFSLPLTTLNQKSFNIAHDEDVITQNKNDEHKGNINILLQDITTDEVYLVLLVSCIKRRKTLPRNRMIFHTFYCKNLLNLFSPF